MKQYLELIPLSAKAHKRQNRLTRLCILFSVFMVTAIFSMAEMGARMEQDRLTQKHGSLTLGQVLGSEMGRSLLGAAGLLFLLVLLAGVLMISGSIRSSVAQRTRFFGMMRCLGMSRRQIVRFVRLEALYWCRSAVPVGVVLGIGASWALCGALRFWVGEEFAHIPLFRLSGMGILCGAGVGVIAVWIAASAPARQAARVSPICAASGAFEAAAFPTGGPFALGKTPAALGVRHALGARKNLALVAGSFGLSILLFLCFSVLVAFVGYLMPQSAAAPDLELSSLDGSNSIPFSLAGRLEKIGGVTQVYGRRSCLGVEVGREFAGGADLISFTAFDLDCLKKDGLLQKGSDLAKVWGDSPCALAVETEGGPQIGNRVEVNGQELEIAGLLRYDPFSEDGQPGRNLTLLLFDETFARLTGQQDYALILLQSSQKLTDQSLGQIEALAEGKALLRDRRDQSTAGTYLAFVACVYSFLGVIALVAALNILNSISMSVTARTRQYGAMRAVGMEGRQLFGMILSEAGTYALLGCLAGFAAGLPLSRLLYEVLIARHFPYAVWHLPVGMLAGILLFVFFFAVLAAWLPARRLLRLSVTETTREL